MQHQEGKHTQQNYSYTCRSSMWLSSYRIIQVTVQQKGCGTKYHALLGVENASF